MAAVKTIPGDDPRDLPHFYRQVEAFSGTGGAHIWSLFIPVFENHLTLDRMVQLQGKVTTSRTSYVQRSMTETSPGTQRKSTGESSPPRAFKDWHRDKTIAWFQMSKNWSYVLQAVKSQVLI